MAQTHKKDARTKDLRRDDALPAVVTSSAPVSKIAQVIALLERAGGATLAEIIESTGRLPHTTRAALTGLRKKGHSIIKESREGVTVYNIGTAAR